MLPNAAMTFIMKKRPQEVASLYCITLLAVQAKAPRRNTTTRKLVTLLTGRLCCDFQKLWSLKFSKMTSDKPHNFFWSLGECRR